MNVFIPDNVLKEILNILKNHRKIEKAIVFGSRAKGEHKPYSDIDIALCGQMGMIDIEHVASDLDELPTVYKFDVVGYSNIKNDELKKHIENVGVIIYEK